MGAETALSIIGVFVRPGSRFWTFALTVGLLTALLAPAASGSELSGREEVDVAMRTDLKKVAAIAETFMTDTGHFPRADEVSAHPMSPVVHFGELSAELQDGNVLEFFARSHNGSNWCASIRRASDAHPGTVTRWSFESHSSKREPRRCDDRYSRVSYDTNAWSIDSRMASDVREIANLMEEFYTGDQMYPTAEDVLVDSETDVVTIGELQHELGLGDQLIELRLSEDGEAYCHVVNREGETAPGTVSGIGYRTDMGGMRFIDSCPGSKFPFVLYTLTPA